LGKTRKVISPWTSERRLTRQARVYPAIKSAAGNSLITEDGQTLLDGSAGLWNANLGHGQPRVIEAVSQALGHLTYVNNVEGQSDISVRLADRLLELAGSKAHVMFQSSGTAAVEAALLLVQRHFQLRGEPSRTGIIALDRSYHGSSLLASSVSGIAADQRWIRPSDLGIEHIPTPDGEDAARESLVVLRSLLSGERASKFACFIFEPVMGVAGMIELPEWWVAEAVTLAKSAGLKIIADEVATGLGRTGSWFASEKVPTDIITVGKGLSAGYVPLAATLVSREILSPHGTGEDVEVRFGSTMDGCPAACAAGLAVLELIHERDLVTRARDLGQMMREKLRPALALRIVKEIRGRGLMIGLPLVNPAHPDAPLPDASIDRIHTALAHAGVVLYPASSTLAIVPPLTISDQEASELCSVIIQVLSRECG